MKYLYVSLTLIAALIVTTSVSYAAGQQRMTNPVRIMPLGDSITEGFAVPGGYRLPLWQRLQAEGIAVDFVGSLSEGPFSGNHHEGHQGFTIAQLDASLDTWLAANPPDIILLQAGTNDAASFQSGGAARLGAMLDHIAARKPDTLVLVSPLTPLDASNLTNAGPERAALVAQFNADLPAVVATRQMAGKRVRLVHVGDTLAVADLADGVHPNVGGYSKLAAGWYAALLQELSACILARRVALTVAPTSSDDLRVIVEARGSGNEVRSITFGSRQNADVSTPSVTGATASFTVHRPAPGAVQVPFIVVDACGSWQTFVGSGPGSFLRRGSGP